ncbi:hypothetical protein RJ639_028304 [Escallonia herrerae]|uniref:Protein WUSCHEL n=1 Tax=Escallonia herrerae TaxID=1293975 RepID=A0AA89BF85_9ASTE|nr:hypothetical protein RJ639_028304 [Escallonia herrerae]
MGDELRDLLHSPNQGHEKAEPARSRWTPKPEQILILESIFNSGMVNPPKDETVRIRKLLEKFGSVGDANVFYWFQNRRSRSRRRQRQIQASLNGGEPPQTSGGAVHSYGYSGVSSFMPSHSLFLPPSGSSSSSCGSVGHHDGVDGMFSFSGHMSIPEREQAPHVNSILCSSDGSILCSPSDSVLQYQSVAAVIMLLIYLCISFKLQTPPAWKMASKDWKSSWEQGPILGNFQ